jgi:hypothetical protein
VLLLTEKGGSKQRTRSLLDIPKALQGLFNNAL